MTPTKNVFIYALVNPFDNRVFYVGCTETIITRYKGHISDKNINSEKVKLIKLITDKGKNPKIIKLETVDLKDASFWEEFYINLFNSFGYKLTNKTNKSTYTSSLVNRYIIKSKNVSIPLRNKVIEDLEMLSMLFSINMDTLIKAALSEFIDKNLKIFKDKKGNYLELFDTKKDIINKSIELSR